VVLRGAGAVAIQFGLVRVSTDTAFEGTGGVVVVDGTEVPAPYRISAIGEPTTLDTALNIPGGIAAVVRAGGGQLTVQELDRVQITATRTLARPRYAQPTR
jgi:uncharacterized protein YlxW (UPF0749 family)